MKEAMTTSHTPGPLTVRVDDELPFTIRTFNSSGECIFARDMPAWSTNQTSSAQAMRGAGLLQDKDAAIAANRRAVADETLRAAAPDLLDALKALTEWGRTHTSPRDANSPHQLLINAVEAIAKAGG